MDPHHLHTFLFAELSEIDSADAHNVIQVGVLGWYNLDSSGEWIQGGSPAQCMQEAGGRSGIVGERSQLLSFQSGQRWPWPLLTQLSVHRGTGSGLGALLVGQD